MKATRPKLPKILTYCSSDVIVWPPYVENVLLHFLERSKKNLSISHIGQTSSRQCVYLKGPSSWFKRHFMCQNLARNADLLDQSWSLSAKV